ncbi:hypothetical protein PY257_14655 [Ramlibacter sp. H39-3-26]|uniref:hypothetical protein n=1 Tax=Curvibacter soli TaxID=3031331 RepID=UPI0023DA2603|nr:hypothetical protein [Ramlibacter sp. H39-3-26]MDF1486403.1 hypothetical protein [Ramlibacter sp. H39-3-26]
MRRYIKPALLVLNLALLLGLAALWLWPDGRLRNMHWQPPAAQKPVFSPVADMAPVAASTSSFVVTLDRPLFSPSRRPPPPPPPANTQAESDPLADIRLYGMYAGGEAGGIIASIGGKNKRVPLGGTLGPWTVQSIAGRDVVFARGGEVRAMHLSYAKMATPPPPAVAAGTAKPPAVSGAPAEQRAAAGGGGGGGEQQRQEIEERQRATLQRRNALRAAAGLRPLN